MNGPVDTVISYLLILGEQGRVLTHIQNYHHEGRHLARCVVDHLLSLYRMGLVRGDNRCFNIVLGTDTDGRRLGRHHGRPPH